MAFRSTLVECRAGHSYPERPTAFTWENTRWQVENVTAEWRTPQRKFFHVRTLQGTIFELAYDFKHEIWQIVPIEQNP